MHFGAKPNKLHTKNATMRVSCQIYSILFCKIAYKSCLYSLTTKWCEERVSKSMSTIMYTKSILS